MAYDRYDRDDRSRWSDNRSDRNWRGNDPRGGRDDRGFWDRASDEVASWFGDEDAERRRKHDTRRDERMGDNDRNWRGYDRNWQADRERAQNRDFDQDRGYGRDYGRDQSAFGGGRSDRDFNYDRGVFNRGGSSDRDYNRTWRSDFRSGDRDFDRNRDWDRNRSFGQDRDFDRNRTTGGGYRPMTGDYGRATDYESDQFYAASGYGRNDYGQDRSDRSQTPYGRDETHRTTQSGWQGDDREHDPHYRSWRDRHMGDLDRDYDDYRRENQSRFENDFTNWRQKRQHKRGLLGQIREHMEVVGDDGKHVGTVDKTAGDRIILTKSDSDSGGTHHSLSCSDIERVEGDKVILDCSADEAKNHWRDESRSRALFEREDQGEMGPRNLNRSFEGTYR
jgi:hypothetical protein